MVDHRLSELERDSKLSQDPHAASRLLLERIRASSLSTRAAARAALFGSPAARLLGLDMNEGGNEDLSQVEMDEVLRIVFGKIDLAPRTREFLNNLVQHDREARETLNHYELIQPGDKEPPDTATTLKALMDDLRENSNHREAIAQMNRPVFQLVPVYDHKGAGFQRMVNAINAHRRDEQNETYVWHELRNRWGMNSHALGKIVGWQVAVVEGDKELLEESNPHRHETLGEQLMLCQKECAQRGVELSDNQSYTLLQMQEIMRAPEGTGLEQMGIDSNTFTLLKDSTRQNGSLVPIGYWRSYQVSFYELLPDVRHDITRFRPSVVVKKIL